MPKQFTEEQIIMHLDGDYNEALAEELKINPELRARVAEYQELITSMHNSRSFELPKHVLAKNSINNIRKPVSYTISMPWAAAVVLLLFGFFAGFSSHSFLSQQTTNDLLVKLTTLQQANLIAVLNTHSASERIAVINQISSLKVNDKLLATLLNTIRYDQNPNVRYEALISLGSNLDKEGIMDKLVNILLSHPDPNIQYYIIDTIVLRKEKKAIKALQQLIKDQRTQQIIKDQAAKAIEQLKIEI